MPTPTALTEAQRVKVRLYLGWPDRFFQTQPVLEQAMNAVDSLLSSSVPAQAAHGAATLAELVTALANAAALDAQLVDAATRLKAAKVGSIELPGGA